MQNKYVNIFNFKNISLILFIAVLFLDCSKSINRENEPITEQRSIIQTLLEQDLAEKNTLLEEAKEETLDVEMIVTILHNFDQDAEYLSPSTREKTNMLTEYFETEIDDINGTWVSHEELLNSSWTTNYNSSWGVAKTIPNTSLDIDLGKNEIRLTGHGLYIITSAYKNDYGTICLEIYSIESFLKTTCFMEFSLLDKHRAYVIFYPLSMLGGDRAFSPEEPCIWYRLSGPEKPEQEVSGSIESEINFIN